MKLKAMNCPVCGGMLEIDTDAHHFFCQHCGTKFESEGDHYTYTENKTHRTIDDAKIKDAEVRKEIKFREMDYHERSEKRKYNQWKTYIILGIIGVCIIVAGYSHFRAKRIEDEYHQQISSATETPETITIEPEIEVTVATVSEAIKPVGELITYKYFYSDIGEFTKDKKLFDKFKIPFTTNQSLYTYSGTIGIGVDAEKIGVDVDSDKKTISVTVPAPYIISNEIDKGSFQSYDIKKSLFTDTELGDYAQLTDELKERQESKLNENEEIWKDAQKSVGSMIEDLLNVYETEAGYSVEVSYE